MTAFGLFGFLAGAGLIGWAGELSVLLVAPVAAFIACMFGYVLLGRSASARALTERGSLSDSPSGCATGIFTISPPGALVNWSLGGAAVGVLLVFSVPSNTMDGLLTFLVFALYAMVAGIALLVWLFRVLTFVVLHVRRPRALVRRRVAVRLLVAPAAIAATAVALQLGVPLGVGRLVAERDLQKVERIAGAACEAEASSLVGERVWSVSVDEVRCVNDGVLLVDQFDVDYGEFGLAYLPAGKGNAFTGDDLRNYSVDYLGGFWYSFVLVTS